MNKSREIHRINFEIDDIKRKIRTINFEINRKLEKIEELVDSLDCLYKEKFLLENNLYKENKERQQNNQKKIDNWLFKEIESAKRNFEKLPSWAKKAARFEGYDPRMFTGFDKSEDSE